jgi:hypothetical protein
MDCRHRGSRQVLGAVKRGLNPRAHDNPPASRLLSFHHPNAHRNAPIVIGIPGALMPALLKRTFKRPNASRVAANNAQYGSLFERRSASTGEHDGIARGLQSETDGAANAAARSRHQRNLCA